MREKARMETRSGIGRGHDARALVCVRSASASAANGAADLGELARADRAPGMSHGAWPEGMGMDMGRGRGRMETRSGRGAGHASLGAWCSGECWAMRWDGGAGVGIEVLERQGRLMRSGRASVEVCCRRASRRGAGARVKRRFPRRRKVRLELLAARAQQHTQEVGAWHSS